jgi:hypothetical protein
MTNENWLVKVIKLSGFPFETADDENSVKHQESDAQKHFISSI